LHFLLSADVIALIVIQEMRRLPVFPRFANRDPRFSMKFAHQQRQLMAYGLFCNLL